MNTEHKGYSIASSSAPPDGITHKDIEHFLLLGLYIH